MASFARVALVVAFIAIPAFVSAAQPVQPTKTIAVPTPRRTPRPIGQPKAVGDAVTATQCSQHVAKTQVNKCDKAVSSNRLVLIWSFSTGGPRPAGFNILRNGHVAVTDIDPKSTGYVMPETLDAVAGTCYAVQAYTTKPAATGQPSKAYCVVAPSVLSPSHVNPSYAFTTRGSRKCNQRFPHSYGPGAPNKKPIGWYSFNDNQGNTDIWSGNPVVNRGEVLLGYSHTSNPGGCGTNLSHIEYRSALWFDLSGVSAATFSHATLSLRVAQAWTDTFEGSETRLPTTTHQFGSGGEPVYIRSEQKNDDSCARTIGYAVNKRWVNSVSKTSLIGFDPGVKVGASTGTMSVDVTTMVKTWLSRSRPNNGFVLAAHDPAPKKLSNIECLTHYDAPKLTLQYR